MSETTGISWTDSTANFWIGCQKVSEGCRNCYAETMARTRMGLNVWGPPATTSRWIVKGVMANVRKWNRKAATDQPWRVFVGSMMDWAEDHPDLVEPRKLMWQAIREAENLTFQMLTKRPQRIVELLPADWGDGYANVWLGTTIEDMRVAERADALRVIPAVVRFISYEPAIGPLHQLDLTGIDWVIYGAESGSGFRPEGTEDDPKQWARRMRRACNKAGVAFFHKQSAAFRTGTGAELNGEIVHEFPTPRMIHASCR